MSLEDEKDASKDDVLPLNVITSEDPEVETADENEGRENPAQSDENPVGHPEEEDPTVGTTNA